jgi:hypothetical protein
MKLNLALLPAFFCLDDACILNPVGICPLSAPAPGYRVTLHYNAIQFVFGTWEKSDGEEE